MKTIKREITIQIYPLANEVHLIETTGGEEKTLARWSANEAARILLDHAEHSIIAKIALDRSLRAADNTGAG